MNTGSWSYLAGSISCFWRHQWDPAAPCSPKPSHSQTGAVWLQLDFALLTDTPWHRLWSAAQTHSLILMGDVFTKMWDFTLLFNVMCFTSNFVVLKLQNADEKYWEVLDQINLDFTPFIHLFIYHKSQCFCIFLFIFSFPFFKKRMPSKSASSLSIFI